PSYYSKHHSSPAIYTLSLHDALPISPRIGSRTTLCLASSLSSRLVIRWEWPRRELFRDGAPRLHANPVPVFMRPLTISVLELVRSEEHTSELQSPDHLVCRLLLEKKK